MESHAIEEWRHLDLNVIPGLAAFGDRLPRENKEYSWRLWMETDLADRQNDCWADGPSRNS